MKVPPQRIERFLRTPDGEICAVLVYGPDEGLVRERADALTTAVVADPRDPFLVAELGARTLRDDPARLADEIGALALTGGRRVVRVREAGDWLTDLLRPLLEDWPGDTLLVAQAGNLPPRSSLRRLAENSPRAAALPCYTDDARSLERLVVETAEAEGISLSAEARAWLADNLGADRALSRAELEKLVLYAGPGGRIELEDAAAIVGDNAAISLEGVVYAAADGEIATLDKALTRSLQEGTSPVAVLRAMANHLLRLQLAAARIRAGESEERAIRSLRPPVFFKLERRFVAQLRSWSDEAIGRALNLVLEAEARCKQTGMPDTAICGRTLTAIAALARPRTVHR